MEKGSASSVKLKPTNDFVFSKLFGTPENKDLLISFLQAVLRVEILDLTVIENRVLDRDVPDDKLGILDVRAELNDRTQVEIEMQLLDQHNIERRTLFYWSKLFSSQIKAGGHYEELPRTITINILGFDYIQLDRYHTSFHLREDLAKEYVLTDVVEIHFVELPKFTRAMVDYNVPLNRWLAFLRKTWEEETEMLALRDEEIRRAYDVLNRMACDPDVMRAYEAREKAILDERSRIDGARKDGFAEGMEKQSRNLVRNLLKRNASMEEICELLDMGRAEAERIVRAVRDEA